MSDEVVVTFEHTSYTWDGHRWYRTADYMTPPNGMIHKLNALRPAEPAPKIKKPATRRA